jgi:hypothetical protein
MKQVNIISLMILSGACLCACLCCLHREDGHRYITFVNKSGKEIVCQEFWSGSITDADTVYQCRIGAVGIPADSLHHFESLDYSGWESDFKVIPYIQYSVMDAMIFDKYIATPCDTIRKYVPILHFYRLTLEDLQQMEWTVVYPPYGE